MDSISIVMLVIGGISILFGFIYGIKRGLSKSIVRIIIVAICAIAAFVMREQITNEVLNYPIDEGKTIIDIISESIISGENPNMDGLVDIVINMVKMVVQIITFILTFLLFKVVSMIAYWIITRIFGMKKPNSRLLGGLVGMLQGVLIIACVLGPVNGLIVNVSSLIDSLSKVEVDGSKIVDDNTISVLEGSGLLVYKDSPVSEVYGVLGNGIYNEISKVKDENGNVIDIKSQIEAINGGVQMADTLLDFTNVDLSNGFTSEVKDELVNVFNELDEIKNGMSEESVQELDTLIKDVIAPLVGETIDLPIDLNEINFAEVDFKNEGEIIETYFDLMERSENEGELDEDLVIEEVVTSLSDSTLILPILTQVVDDLPEDQKPTFTEEQKEKIEEVINNLENKQNVDKLKEFFGIE